MKNHPESFPDEPSDDLLNSPDELYDGPSKSSLKREMTALQKLGEALTELSPERLKKIDMPERLRDALRDAQRFTQHGARRRQMQLIGKIMREIDAAPLQAALDEINGVSAAATLRQQRLERLRTRLLEDEAVCTGIARDYPGADIQQLRQLRRNALKEAEQNKPPRAYRELFRVLRELEGKVMHSGILESVSGQPDDAEKQLRYKEAVEQKTLSSP